MDGGNRLLTDEYNKVIGTRNVYAMGDACLLTSDQNFPQGHPQLAQVALDLGTVTRPCHYLHDVVESDS